MELILNIAWVALTAAMCLLWLRFGLREGTSRRTQLVALAMLLLIIFPVISVSDDLLAAQNPAEADCCVRRDHLVDAAPSILDTVADLVRPMLAELQSGAQRLAAPGYACPPSLDRPALAAIDNRPPPAA